MALNQSAINVKVINGAETTQFSKALIVTSTVVASFLRGLATIKSIVSSTTSILSSSFIYLKDLIANLTTSSASIIKGPYGKLLSTTSSTINSLTRQLSLFITLAFTSTTSATLLRYLSKVILEVEVVTATILTATNRLITLLAYSTTTVNFQRNITLAISLIVSTVTSTLTKAITFIKIITASVSSTAILLAYKIYYKYLTVISSSTTSIIKSIQKPLTISVNCGIILSKSVLKLINSFSTVLTTLITSAISFTRYPVNRLIYAATKIRKIFYN